MKVIPLPSRGSVEIVLSDLLTDGTLNINPEIEARDYLRFHFRGKKLEVMAGKYIGLIPINENVTVDVQPKLPVSNLARVVDGAQFPIESIVSAKRPYAAEAESSVSTVEFLARSLVEAIRPIASNGLARQYRQETRVGPSLRGRVLHSSTLRHRAKHPLSAVATTSLFAPTVDHRLNRVIKLALVFLSRRLSVSSPQSRRTAAAVNQCLWLFEGVRFGCSDAEIDAAARDLRANRFGRQYYGRVVRIALFVLQHRGLSLTAQIPSAIELASYVIDFESLFEAYLRNTLRTRLQAVSRRVRDGNRDGAKWLFDERKGAKANPDIVIEGDSRNAIGLVEVKYKDHLDRADVNQCISYGFSYRVATVWLVRQRKGSESRTQPIGTIGTVRLMEYRFDLASADLVSEEEAFARSVEEGLPGPLP